MRYFERCTIQSSFKILCVFATGSMIIYWILRFLRNEDVSSIEIKSIDETIQDFTQLEITICLANPFYENRLNKLDASMSRKDYMKYLRGAENDTSSYSKLDFEDITIHIPDQLESFLVHWRLGSSEELSDCRDINTCPYATIKDSIHGFLRRDTFVKCSKIELNDEYAKNIDKITLKFKSTLTNLIDEYDDLYLFFN